MNGPAASGADQLARLLKLRHTPLLRTDLDDARMLVLGVDDRRSFGEIMRQRLLDVDILAGGAGVHGHGHMPMIGRADEYGLNVLAIEHFLVVLGGERFGIGQFAAFVQMGIPNVAHGRDADIRDLGQRFHKVLAASAGADTADVDRIVGTQDVDGRHGKGGGDGGGFQERTTSEIVERFHAKFSRSPYRTSAQTSGSTPNARS